MGKSAEEVHLVFLGEENTAWLPAAMLRAWGDEVLILILILAVLVLPVLVLICILVRVLVRIHILRPGGQEWRCQGGGVE